MPNKKNGSQKAPIFYIRLITKFIFIRLALTDLIRWTAVPATVLEV